MLCPWESRSAATCWDAPAKPSLWSSPSLLTQLSLSFSPPIHLLSFVSSICTFSVHSFPYSCFCITFIFSLFAPAPLLFFPPFLLFFFPQFFFILCLAYFFSPYTILLVLLGSYCYFINFRSYKDTGKKKESELCLISCGWASYFMFGWLLVAKK